MFGKKKEIIKNCPHCGAKASYLTAVGEHFFVCADNCKGPFKSKEEALNKWNMREER